MATLITKNSSTASAVPAAGDLVKGELAVNVTDKKVYTKDNSAAVVKLVGSLGNQEANAVAITGGAINGTTIGATTPSTGAFTTASASGGFTGNLTGNVTGNVSGTAANVTGVVAIANGGTGLSSLGTGVQSALGQAVTGSGSFVLSTSPSLTTPNLGTPSAAVLTNATGLPLTTGVTGTLGVANGGTGITAFGTGVATALGQNVTGSGGIVLATSPSLTTPNLGTPSAATLTNATGLPISTGVSGLGTGVATALAVNTGSAGAFVVNGGALGTPSSGTVTNLTGTASININGTVGATTPTTGAFTTLSASGNITVSGGTANGVAYLNGSKVLTTGSALSFNGTRFTTYVTSDTNTNIARFGVVNTAITDDAFLDISADAANNLITLNSTGNNAGSFAFQTGGSEQMRLTSTGLGIGTTSPGQKAVINGGLSIIGSATLSASQGGGLISYEHPTTRCYVGDGTGYSWAFSKRAASVTTDLMTLTDSGNLGLGVTPSAWDSAYTAFDIKRGSVFQNSASNWVGLANNAYNNGTNWIYKESTVPRIFRIQNDQFEWLTAPSGTAGNAISFTQAMTLDASGRLMVGTTTPDTPLSGGLTLSASANNTDTTQAYLSSIFAIKNTDRTTNNLTAMYFDGLSSGGSVRGLGAIGMQTTSWTDGAINSNMLFWTSGSGTVAERARITSGGYFKASNTGTYTGSTVSYHESYTNTSNYTHVFTNANASPVGALFLHSTDSNGTGNEFWSCQGATTQRAAIRSNGGLANYSGNNVNLSDRREKTNFAPAKSYLDTICAIPVQTFNYIDQSEDDPGLTLGVVAQDVQAVAPELVMESNWGTAEDPKMRLSIYQTDLQYALMKCIQELKAQNDDLRARVAQLEAK